MQSFLQYRRIGEAAAAQIERDVERARLMTRNNSSAVAAGPSAATPTPGGPAQTEAGAVPTEEKEAAAAAELGTTTSTGENVPTQPGTGTGSHGDHGPSVEGQGEHPLTEQIMTAEAARSPSPSPSSPASEKRHDADVESKFPTSRSRASSSSTTSSSPSDADMARFPTAGTQYTARAALGHSLTGIHARDRRTHEGKDLGQVFVVGWEGAGDPLCPRNWPTRKRVGVVLQISFLAAAVGAASGIDATILPQAAKDLGVSEVAESLATGLYLVGMGVGSFVAGPFSETFGRNRVYLGSMVIFAIWVMASGLAPNFGAQIAFRFLAGCSASTPLVCSGGSIADMFDSLEKTWAFPLYAIAAFGGPMLGAVMGAYIGPSPLVSWRWTEWTMLILSGVVIALVGLAMPETFAPVLLRWKAAHFRRLTGDERFRAAHEIVEATLGSRLRVSMTRPFVLVREPIILAMSLYLTVVYIVLFTFLIGWPSIYQDVYGTSQGLTNVIFVAMFVGLQFCFVLIPVIYSWTARAMKKAAEQHVPAEGGGGATDHPPFQPEIRLWYAMLGSAPAIPISLFWMGWTDRASISIWSPILAAALFGYGVIGVFISAYMYLIDAYETYAASALTFASFIRYLAAGGMTVVGLPFYDSMGATYTLTILACISCVLVPVPYVLYRWGHLVRGRSKFAVSREGEVG